MFDECSSLTNLNLSNFNTTNVTDMSYMFSECSSLTNLNLSSFNTTNVTNMSFMLLGCSSLTNLNLSNFNTTKVTNMSYMFDGCSSLTNLNLSNFNTDAAALYKGVAATTIIPSIVATTAAAIATNDPSLFIDTSLTKFNVVRDIPTEVVKPQVVKPPFQYNY